MIGRGCLGKGVSMLSLSNDQREWMCRNNLANVAMVVDGLLWHSVNAGEWVTVADVVGLLGCSMYQARQALAEGCFKERSVKQEGRGRPTLHYRVPSPGEVGRYYDIPATGPIVSDPLPEWAFTSAANFKKALHRSFLIRSSISGTTWAEFPRKWMADRLGVCPKTLRDYEKTYPFQNLEIQQQIEIIAKLLPDRDYRLADRFRRGAAYLVAAASEDEVASGGGRPGPATDGYANYCLQAGQEIWLVKRGYNLYKMAA